MSFFIIIKKFNRCDFDSTFFIYSSQF